MYTGIIKWVNSVKTDSSSISFQSEVFLNVFNCIVSKCYHNNEALSKVAQNDV